MISDFDIPRAGEGFVVKSQLCIGDHPALPQDTALYPNPLKKHDLYIQIDDNDWAPLYPFVTAEACPHCRTREIYSIDKWDSQNKSALLKSFERGHTVDSTAVAELLQHL